jgi:hypothetical protein
MTDVLEPLIWNGQTLAIPRASPTQDGYIGKDTFVLFSGDAVVPVNSFNTRTGEVVLLSDDVLAALGYTPFNRAGDTMTGPLTLAAAPTASLHAATKAYVDTGIPGTYRVTAFKASGSATKFTGTIASGSKTLTLASSTPDFEVGQGILITGAGASSGNLLTKVDAVAGLSITLHDAASTTRSSTNVQHDDTVAIQTAMDTVCSSGGGTLYFPTGFYRINGPLQSTNSILKIPFNPTTNAAIALSLVGFSPAFITWQGPVSTTGVIIQTDRVGTDANSCMLAGALFNITPDYSLVNNTKFALEGMVWETYDNPGISAIDLGMVGTHVSVRNIGIDAGVPLLTASQPTHGTFGIRLPRNNVVTELGVENVEISNYAIGMIACEVLHALNVTTQRCLTGLQITPGHHLVSGRFLLWQCATLLEITGSATIPTVIDLLIDIEKAPSSGNWWSSIPGHDFYDPTDSALGKIEYVAVTGGVGRDAPTTQAGELQTASVTGMTGVTLVNLGA